MAQRFVDPRAPLPRPDWVKQINREGEIWRAAGMLSDMVPLDADSLLAAARRETGLEDLGEDDWQEPLAVLTADVGQMDGWFEYQDRLARLSTNSVHRTAHGATHGALLEDSRFAAITSRTIAGVVRAVRNEER